MTLAEGTFGGLAGQEIELFRSVLTGMKGTGVEIGCLDGYSTAHLLECSELHMTSIDPFIPDSCASHLIGSKERFRFNVEPWKDRSHLIEDYSWNARPAWEKPLDFLFIDGDHAYDAVLKDFLMWTPLLRTGGVLAMHDSRMNRPGGATFHVGPSKVAAERIYDAPHHWRVLGEAFSLTVARKL